MHSIQHFTRILSNKHIPAILTPISLHYLLQVKGSNYCKEGLRFFIFIGHSLVSLECLNFGQVVWNFFHQYSKNVHSIIHDQSLIPTITKILIHPFAKFKWNSPVQYGGIYWLNYIFFF